MGSWIGKSGAEKLRSVVFEIIIREVVISPQGWTKSLMMNRSKEEVREGQRPSPGTFQRLSAG